MEPELYHPPALPQMDLWKEVVGSLATIDHLITMSEKLPDAPLDQKAITMMMRREVSKLAGALKEVRIFERTTDVKIA